LWLPAVPGFALKLLLGEMADLVLYGSNVTSERIKQAGFSFKFDTLEKALNNLLKH
jgi:NAD dependent epimerase/dehydratase family enzyme